MFKQSNKRAIWEYSKLSFNNLKVVFPFEDEQKVTSKVEGKVEGKLTPTQQNIINAMQKDPAITASKLAEQFAMSEYGIRKNIAKLKELGIIERVGSDKNGTWKVVL